VYFRLNFARDPSNLSAPAKLGHVVYCGVRVQPEPYVLDVAATYPAFPGEPGSPGWLAVHFQGGEQDHALNEYWVPVGESFSFSLSLGGKPNLDRLVQITSHPLGDENGGGAPFIGRASVRARQGAEDPFKGDGANDNFCVTIGVPGPDGLPAEFVEGQISTNMQVPNDWVLDGNGSDGGVLAAFPH
jgi:hypothetical protein